MRCLVTGGFGFIGSHIVERLIKEGHFVRVLDNMEKAKVFDFENLNGKIEIINGDILNFGTCKLACLGIDVVFHNAAIASIGESKKHPLKTIEINSNGTFNLLYAAANSKIRRFIFSSSAKIYGNSSKFPQSETDAQDILTTYALSKSIAETHCKFFSERYGLEVISLRHFSVYGPRQALKDGFIGQAIESIGNEREPIFYCTPNFLRDFTYIDDVVEANILATNIKNAKFEIFNTGTGTEYSITKMTELVNEALNKNFKPIFLPPPEGSVSRTLSNTSKARSFLNYFPKVSLREGLSKTVDWFKDRQLSQIVAQD